MADEQYRWLDRETAERLLRGESPDMAVDPVAREHAERLAETLGALAASPPSGPTELPGEAAALAAFRAARADRSAEQAAVERAVHAADAGLVRITRRSGRNERRRWGRSLRLGVSAALAVGMVGGVAVAAGTGLLPTPFGSTEPGPAASPTAGATPDRPTDSPSPADTPGGAGGEATPDGATNGATGRDTARNSPGSGAGSDERPGTGSRWGGAAEACRDLSVGRELEVERRRALEGAAGGSPRVDEYCEGVLGTAAGKGEDGSADGQDKNREAGGQGEPGGQDESGNGGNDGKGNDDRPDVPRNGAGGHLDGAADTPSTSPSLEPAGVQPSPTYSAL